MKEKGRVIENVMVKKKKVIHGILSNMYFKFLTI